MVTIWCHYRDWKLAVFSTPSIDIFFYDKTRHKWPSSLVSLPPLHLKIAVPIYIDKKIYRAERYHISIMVIHFPHFLIFYDSASSIRSFYKLFWCCHGIFEYNKASHRVASKRTVFTKWYLVFSYYSSLNDILIPRKMAIILHQAHKWWIGLFQCFSRYQTTAIFEALYS